jgi:hypothetical protein
MRRPKRLPLFWALQVALGAMGLVLSSGGCLDFNEAARRCMDEGRCERGSVHTEVPPELSPARPPVRPRISDQEPTRGCASTTRTSSFKKMGDSKSSRGS